jgi:hypothetical protein
MVHPAGFSVKFSGQRVQAARWRIITMNGLMRIVFVSATLIAVAGFSSTGSATSGPGCFRVVGVQNWDVLNLRSKPSARSAIVARIPPTDHGIIAQDGPCRPLNVPLASRWCPVGYYDGDFTAQGFVKRRYLAASDCP